MTTGQLEMVKTGAGLLAAVIGGAAVFFGIQYLMPGSKDSDQDDNGGMDAEELARRAEEIAAMKKKVLEDGVGYYVGEGKPEKHLAGDKTYKDAVEMGLIIPLSEAAKRKKEGFMPNISSQFAGLPESGQKIINGIRVGQQALNGIMSILTGLATVAQNINRMFNKDYYSGNMMSDPASCTGAFGPQMIPAANNNYPIFGGGFQQQPYGNGYGGYNQPPRGYNPNPDQGMLIFDQAKYPTSSHMKSLQWEWAKHVGDPNLFREESIQIAEEGGGCRLTKEGSIASFFGEPEWETALNEMQRRG